MNVNCPNCQLLLDCTPEIAGQQVACPRCNQLLQMPVDEPPAIRISGSRSPSRKSSGNDQFATAALFVFVAGFCGLIIFCCGGFVNHVKEQDSIPYGASGSEAAERDVVQLAKASTKQVLKYPLDAEFDWAPDVLCFPKAGKWRVNGTVKAMNGFGAKLTHTYSVVMTLKNQNAREWEVDFVELNGETMYRK